MNSNQKATNTFRKNKYNILQVLPDLNSGGVERGAVEIGKFLAQQGYGSFIVSAGGPLVSQLYDYGVIHTQLPLNRKSIWHLYNNAKALVKLIKTLQIDIIHVRSRAPAWSILYAAHITKRPVISTFHGYYEHNNCFQRFYNSSMIRTNEIIAVSDFIKQHIISTYNISKNKVHTIHRGVNLDYFNIDNVSQERLMNRWHSLQLKDNIPVILLPGRITRTKGHLLLLQALSMIKNRDFYCIFVGKCNFNSNYVSEINRKIIDFGLGQQVKIFQESSDMPATYMCADIIVVPSALPEPFGRVAIEGQAMQKIVIASNAGGYCESIIDGVTGLLFEHNSAESLAQVLDTALDLDANKFANQSRKHVADNFSLDKMCNSTLDIYSAYLKR